MNQFKIYFHIIKYIKNYKLINNIFKYINKSILINKNILNLYLKMFNDISLASAVLIKNSK